MKVELLAPAGNLEKLKIAVIYGANAVYIGGQHYSLRARAGNFTLDEMKEGVRFAHSYNRRVYLAMNIIPHNSDFDGLDEYIKEVVDTGIDAIIVSDCGVFSMIKKIAPEMEVHLSTQAGNTNYQSVLFWYNQGVKRVILARELSIKEIKQISKRVPSDMELEVFVHGAMCISYSGRCLLSNYMAGRDSNKGDCAHPCRWRYHLMEETRKEEYMPIYEDETGTFIFNSKDLCMIKHIPELVESGVSSFKIEGRMKSVYYVAAVVKAYRMAIDEYLKNPKEYKFRDIWFEEVASVSHRGFTTGFFFGKPDQDSQNYRTASYTRNYDFVGVVLEYKDENIAVVEQRNKLFVGDKLEVLSPDSDNFEFTLTEMKDKDGKVIYDAPHPRMRVYIKIPKKVSKFSILRRKIVG